MILNGLGFTERRLYLVSSFFKNKPVDKYLGDGVKASDLSDDTLGRTLDAIYAYGTTKFFGEIAFEIAQEFNFLGRSAHLDSSTISVEGQYDNNETEMKITYGHSKDHRHDLKQITLSLITTGESSFPIWMEGLSGNSSDKSSFHQSIDALEKFQKDLKSAPSFYWVADSALYSKNKLLAHEDSVKWLTRVPESIKAAKLLTQEENLNWTTINEKYKFVEVGPYYAGIRQRWIIIESEQAKRRELKTLERKIEKSEKELIKLSKSKGKERFYSTEEIEKEIKKLRSKYKLFNIEYTFHKFKAQKKDFLKITLSFEKNIDEINKVKRSKGRFIIATNEIIENLSAEKLLHEYKAQEKTERGFRFIKDDSFLLSDVYLKKPERVQALMAIMCLSLMVYNVGEYLLRKNMAENKKKVENIVGKLVSKPTLKMVFSMMKAIDLVTINLESEVKLVVTNLTDNHKKILDFLGPEFVGMYDF
jgi:transposase